MANVCTVLIALALLLAVAQSALLGTDNNFRVLNGGVKISKLGIGTWAWGDQRYWRYSSDQDLALQETFNYCLQRGGVNFFDTAEVYGGGKSELLLGRFRRSFSDVKPMIGTKFAPKPWVRGSDAVMTACRNSMDRLGVDSLGLYQIHWPAPGANEGYWDGVAKCYQKGWIRSVGVSNYGPAQLRAVHKFLGERGVPLGSNQVQYSLLSRGAEYSDLIKTADELGVVTLAYSPLGQGILTGKYTMRDVPPGPRGALVAAAVPRARQLNKAIQGVAEAKTGSLGFPVSMAQVAINWCIAKGTVPIVGARTKEQAQDNCAALKWSLTQEEVIMLDAISKDSALNLPNPLMGMGMSLPGFVKNLPIPRVRRETAALP
eukprot:CAMPEP_0173239448 /NCGR_PEP_ID=MMETSP1142-20121109/13218_1 /TAXON_ID=483371 /ORGANISM="non described non described, Strain CCMP2298" /LENGTH=373 /DNA_ID=CAMNT_0014170463 /DNA_START=158 /DNA_END=1275 /DNA_ORIENTATION=+